MLVRLNIGRKAGTIQDIEISAAKAMIADGRASAIDYGVQNGDSVGVAKLVTDTPEMAVASTKAAKKK